MSRQSFEIVIGNRVTSSWSLRGWLALALTGVEFGEVVIDMYGASGRRELDAAGPSRKVPVLRQGDLQVWDTLSIIEYLNERFPEAGLWPEDSEARAVARSVAAEMHSGFMALRRELPMNLRRKPALKDVTPDCRKDIDRVGEIWANCRLRFGAAGGDGPFLFGAYCAADIMFTPVALRFWSYSVEVDDMAQAYLLATLNHPLVKTWRDAAAAETWPTPYDADNAPG